MQENIYCIDFEASGLETKSFSIEVALAGIDGNVRSWLIRPLPSWLKNGEWNKQSEAIHELTLPFLEAQGIAPQEVAAEMRAMAGDTIIPER